MHTERITRGVRFWFGTAAGVLLIFILAVSAMASAYDPLKKGSILVQTDSGAAADDGETAGLEGLEFSLYKVGSTVSDTGSPGYVIDNDLAAANVDINALETSDDAKTAAYKLLAVAGTVNLEPVEKKMLESDGTVRFDDLVQGIYILTKSAGDEDVIVYPSLLAIPSIEKAAADGTDASVTTNALTLNYDLTVSPKLVISSRRGSVEVTKHISFRDPNTGRQLSLNVPINIEEDFNFGLFYDKEGIAPVIVDGKECRQVLAIRGNTSNTITFDNLPAGVYYILECDENWKPVKLASEGENSSGTSISYVTYVTAGGKASTGELEFDLSAPEGEWNKKVGVENMYITELPEGLKLDGRIQIKKNVRKNGGSEQDTADDYTFYAGIFTIKEENGTKTEELFDVVELKNNDTVTVDVPLGGEDGMQPITYKIYEMQAAGETDDGQMQFTYVGSDFPFECDIISGKEITLTYDEAAGSVPDGTLTITNTRKDITPTPVPSASPTVTPTKAPTKTPTPTPPEGEMTPPPERYTPTPRYVVISQPPVNIRTDSTSVVHNTTTTTTTTNSVRTGDDTPITLYVILLAAAAGIVIFIIVRKRRR